MGAYSVAQGVDAEDEFFSDCFSDVSGDDEIFYEVSTP
jgi:hypothetical protein